MSLLSPLARLPPSRPIRPGNSSLDPQDELDPAFQTDESPTDQASNQYHPCLRPNGYVKKIDLDTPGHEEDIHGLWDPRP